MCTSVVFEIADAHIRGGQSISHSTLASNINHAKYGRMVGKYELGAEMGVRLGCDKLAATVPVKSSAKGMSARI